ncbi:GlsB/YeaQ/YmgE family stress response membrane protein [Paracoccaceae bacterium GXU_MW_L88]
MGFILTIIIGGLAGWIASNIMDSPNGILVNIVLGILGATVGGWLLSLGGLDTSGGLIVRLLVAVFGAAVLIWIARLIRK